MARSLQQQLDDCDAAIARIENGAQEYTVRGRMAQQARYAALVKERRELQEQVADVSVNSGRMASLGQIGSPQ